MPVQWKKIARVLILLGGMTLALTACQDSVPKEGQIKEDIPEDMRVIYVDSGFGEETITLDVTEVNILKRQTNEKDDTVYCTVSMENADYKYTANWVLTYNYYDQGGWILDDWYADEESNTPEIIPLSGISTEIAEAEMNNFYFDSYSLQNEVFGGDSGSGYAKATYFDYAVEYTGEYCSYHGNVSLDYYFENDGNHGYWTCNILDYDDDWEWDIRGKWECSTVETTGLDVYDFDVEVVGIDEENNLIDMIVTEYDRGMGGFTFNSVEAYTIEVTDQAYSWDYGSGYDDDGNWVVNYEAPSISFYLPFDDYDATIVEFMVVWSPDSALIRPMTDDTSFGRSAELVRSTVA